mmetsp:Transcript_15889/g.51730  ORF Transcript_15889/g.51730 Transcript_15889/m.51730 type:complete len:256 (+) Transcript_15889:457-1224(+)
MGLDRSGSTAKPSKSPNSRSSTGRRRHAPSPTVWCHSAPTPARSRRRSWARRRFSDALRPLQDARSWSKRPLDTRRLPVDTRFGGFCAAAGRPSSTAMGGATGGAPRDRGGGAGTAGANDGGATPRSAAGTTRSFANVADTKARPTFKALRTAPSATSAKSKMPSPITELPFSATTTSPRRTAAAFASPPSSSVVTRRNPPSAATDTPQASVAESGRSRLRNDDRRSAENDDRRRPGWSSQSSSSSISAAGSLTV